MNKFIPYEKLSKSKRREMDSARRGSWGAISPVTRKPPSPKAYSRKKTRTWTQESSMSGPYYVCISCGGDTPISAP